MAITKQGGKQTRKGLWSGGFSLLVIVLLACQWQYTQAAPVAQAGPLTVPSPNAYDYYVKAGKAKVTGTPAIDPIYGKGGNRDGVALNEHLYPLAVKQAWLQQNAAALALLRQGFAYPYLEPAQQGFLPMGAFRELARILIVESHAREQQGDWRGASASTLDAMRLGYDVAHGGPLISALVSYALQAISLREMWHILPHLDGPATHAAIQRLTALREHRVLFADTMAQEKQFGLAQMKVANWRHDLGDELTAAQKNEVATIPDSTIVGNYTRFMDAVISNSRRPYKQERPLPPPGDPITAIMTPIFTNARWNAARTDANDDMFLVALALRAYQLEHGTCPPGLADLVPTYLDQVPLDPFGGGESLRYRAQGDKYVLWSIGPDGLDNNGEPIHDAKAANEPNPEFMWYVMPDSKGDIVAGINR